MFDWTKATDEVKFPVQTTTQKYTSGLIELRKSTNAFRLGDQSLVNSNVTLIPANEIKTDDLVIGYKNKSTDGTGNYYVFMNGDSQPRTLTLGDDLTQGSVLVDNDQAGTSAIPAKDQSGFKLTTNSIELEPLTAVIIKQDAAAAKLSSLVPDSRNYSLQVNDTHQTTVVAKYDDGSKASVTGTATYVSDKPEVATVTDKGLVKATGLGTATITVSYGGRSKTVTVLVNPKRFVQLTYTRPDKDFKDWNLWVWNTGVKNDQIDFTIKDGKASVLIEVAPNATNVGFVLRKGTDWATAKQDFPNDRYIPLTPGELFTKVNVTSMVRELDIKPSNTGPVMKDGSITFIYRDDDLFRQGTMTDITAVKVKVNGTEYPMVYDETKEWFSYKLTKANEGDNNYTFLVTTKDGNTTEVNDPKNTVDGKSVLVYHNPTVKVTASVNPAAVTSNQNAVLTVKADSSLAGVSYREGTLDLTALGGPSQVKLDTALMKQTIAVKDTVAAGIKTIPITLVDQYGNTHKGSTTIEVKARTYTGDKLDFDWDEARIYFALTDRFKDGDLSNDYNVDKTHPEAYHGGDFRGMIDNLDYIQKLGINTLWITPIVDNIDFNKGADFGSKQYGYHGYWAKDFSQLDEHLGDMATFKELINKAHDRGIKVMVDVVLNHTGYGVKEDDDDYPTITPEDKERFKGMLRMDNVSADTDPVKGELAYLPDFKTEDPAVRDKVVAWQSGWLDNARTDRGDTIDYFRVDTVKHVDGTTWKAFKNALTTIDPKFKLVGEYFGGTIDNNGDMLQTGQMDGLLDFGFKDAAKNFANGKINDTDAYMQDRESKIDNTKTMAQFLSSHDENGFLTEYVGGDKGKLKVAAALQITAKGQPVIYYGEELGNSGKKEGDMSKGEFSQNRSDMPWDKLTTEQALHDHYQKLLNIRAKYSKVFSKGTRTKLAGTDELGYLAFNKHYGSEDVVTVINTNTTAASATFTVPFAANALVQDEYSGKTYTVSADRKVTVSVPGRDSGGTVILAAAQTSTPGNPTPGNPTPGNPTPSPSVPTTPSDSQVVNESSLKNGKDGKVEVGIAQGKKSVLLPIQAAKALGTNDLVIKLGSLNVTLPSGVLSTIQGMVSGAEADGSQIRFEANPLESSSANTTVGRLQRNGAKVSQASDVYEFTISIIKKDGTRIPVTTFKEPITVSFKLTGNPNKDLIGVYYLADNGTLEYVGGVLNGDVLTAKVKHFSKYAALEIDKSFADVPASHWASAAIKSLTAKQIVTGVTDTKYQPNSNVSRAEFTALLTRALGLQTDEHAAFADVKPGAWYASYVDAAVKAGIVNGRSKDTFAPNETISREEMAVMLIRALEVKQGKKTDAAASAAAFADASKISSWAASYVNTAASLELVQGKENHQFDPQGFMTRAESAQVIYKLLAK
ncbi:Alpha-amylase precursor [compost metagenome]